jgi:hypothetical protein
MDNCICLPQGIANPNPELDFGSGPGQANSWLHSIVVLSREINGPFEEMSRLLGDEVYQ